MARKKRTAPINGYEVLRIYRLRKSGWQWKDIATTTGKNISTCHELYNRWSEWALETNSILKEREARTTYLICNEA